MTESNTLSNVLWKCTFGYEGQLLERKGYKCISPLMYDLTKDHKKYLKVTW